mgnify:FL=1
MLRMISLILVLVFNLQMDHASKSQEVGDDGIPVIIKHLPDWETKKDSAILMKTKEELIEALGDRAIFQAVEFVGGAEAVTAEYPSGRLLIIEHNTPQLSIDADAKIKTRLDELADNSIIYRRIGNYNVFVLDVKNVQDANALFDKVRYEKVVQWLSEDPFQWEKLQRAYALFVGQMLFSTILAVLLGVGASAILGVCVGMVIFHVRERKRKKWTRFSDAGGMIRLNLDELQEMPDRKLLKD